VIGMSTSYVDDILIGVGSIVKDSNVYNNFYGLCVAHKHMSPEWDMSIDDPEYIMKVCNLQLSGVQISNELSEYIHHKDLFPFLLCGLVNVKPSHVTRFISEVLSNSNVESYVLSSLMYGVSCKAVINELYNLWSNGLSMESLLNVIHIVCRNAYDSARFGYSMPIHYIGGYRSSIEFLSRVMNDDWVNLDMVLNCPDDMVLTNHMCAYTVSMVSGHLESYGVRVSSSQLYISDCSGYNFRVYFFADGKFVDDWSIASFVCDDGLPCIRFRVVIEKLLKLGFMNCSCSMVGNRALVFNFSKSFCNSLPIHTVPGLEVDNYMNTILTHILKSYSNTLFN
jgi:hypothetical protein